jgi:serine kinase of HPr protein (carbohydrate metabolism regulator)
MQSYHGDNGGNPAHATCMSFRGRGLLITGPSGSGKSDLALRLLDREGWRLVSDDRVVLEKTGKMICASAPEKIRGLMEVRGQELLMLTDLELAGPVDLHAVVRLEAEVASVQRLPDPAWCTVLGEPVRELVLWPFEPSAAIKVERWLTRIATTNARPESGFGGLPGENA